MAKFLQGKDFQNKWEVLFVGILVALFTLGFGYLLFGDMSRPEAARITLEKQGYKNVRSLDSANFMQCSNGDLFRTKFTAENFENKTVSGVICKGFVWGKASTIRFVD